MMNIKLRRLIAALVAAVLFCAASVPVLAAKVGSIAVEIIDEDDKPVTGFEVFLVRVAGIDAKLVGAFKAAGIAPDRLKDEKYNANNAKRLLAYADSAAAEKKAAATDGCLVFENLTEGVYLVYDAGNEDYVFDPFLVMVPTAINSSEIYDIVASPKIEPDTPPGPGGPGGGITPTPEPTDDPDEPEPLPEPTDTPESPTPTPEPTETPDEPEPTPTPKPDDGPVLPLTGVERRPIWVLLGLGGALIVAGILQLSVRRRSHE